MVVVVESVELAVVGAVVVLVDVVSAGWGSAELSLALCIKVRMAFRKTFISSLCETKI